jgi:hypothetical protein
VGKEVDDLLSLECPPSFKSRDGFHQLHGRHTKSVSKSDDVEQANVAFAAFDSSDIISVQVRQLGEALLRQASLHPQFADSLAK